MPSVENGINLIHQFAESSRSGLSEAIQTPRKVEPANTIHVPSQRIREAYTTPAPEETLEQRRARAAVIARQELADAGAPNRTRSDAENKSLITKAALGGGALLLAFAAYSGISEAKQKVEELSSFLGDLTTVDTQR